MEVAPYCLLAEVEVGDYPILKEEEEQHVVWLEEARHLAVEDLVWWEELGNMLLFEVEEEEVPTSSSKEEEPSV